MSVCVRGIASASRNIVFLSGCFCQLHAVAQSRKIQRRGQFHMTAGKHPGCDVECACPTPLVLRFVQDRGCTRGAFLRAPSHLPCPRPIFRLGGQESPVKPSLARRCVETATPTKIWQVHPTGGHVESTGTFIYQIMRWCFSVLCQHRVGRSVYAGWAWSLSCCSRLRFGG